MAEQPAHELASPEDWNRARMREAILRPLAGRSSLSQSDVSVAAKRMGVGRAYFYKLLAAYRLRPQTSSLLCQAKGLRTGTNLLPDDAESVIHKCIRDFYASSVRPSFAALMRRIVQDCQRRNVPAPNYRTVKRRLSTYDPKVLVRGRLGAKAAREAFQPVQVNPHPTVPLRLVQIDHTPVDIVVVDDRDRLPIGRPWLSLAVDVATRMVAGFYISLDVPSVISVALVLTHCVLPKDRWLSERGLNSVQWPVYGLPDEIHLDNAKEFHSHALMRGAQEYGIELSYRPSRQPHFGGHIERLIGTTMGAVHLLPGTTFSNVREKGSYDAVAEAAMTTTELERWLALEIARYHLTVHSGLKVPPITAWENGIRVREPLRQVSNAKQFFCNFLPAERRLIRRDGIRLFNIHYWSNVLSPLAGRSERPVLVKYDPRDLSRIYVSDGDGQYWEIPYRDLRLPPISLWEHRAAVKQLLAEGRRAVDERLLFAIVEQQRKVAERARDTTRSRRNAARRTEATRDTSRERPVDHEKSERPDIADGKSIQPFEVEEWD